MDSTSTCHCSNLKIRFEELSYKFYLIRKSAHSTTTFLRLSFVDDEVFVFAKKGGEWLGDFHKVLNKSLVEVDVLKKAPQI